MDTLRRIATLAAMSLFGFLGSGKAEPAPKLTAQDKLIAMVLLKEAVLPDVAAVSAAMKEFGAGADLPTVEATKENDNHALVVNYPGGGAVIVGLMPAPVPGEEAEAHFPYSLSSFTAKDGLPPHRAHLLVAFLGTKDGTAIHTMMRFTTLLAALLQSADAIGAYWGDAGATHTAEFFLSVAKSPSISPRIMLWSGISRAREKSGQISYLSRGMNQLGLPDLYLVFRKTSPSEALERFYDLLAYVADRGEAIPAGDTIGVSAEERIPVAYVKNPGGKKESVWKVELP